MPLISVILAVYNGERFLVPALESILNQTLRDFEFIITDDGSTDSTPQILEQYRLRDKRIKILTNQPNSGAVVSINRALEVATGKFIARMDGDDFCSADRFQKQITYLQQHPEIGMLGTQHNVIDDAGRFLYRSYFPTAPAAIRWTLNFACCLSHPTVMVRNGIIQSVGGYTSDAKAAEDYDLWIRVARSTRISNLPEWLHTYRFWSRNTSITNNEMQEKNGNRVAQQAISYVLGYEVSIHAASQLRGLSHIKAGTIGAKSENLSEVREAADLLRQMVTTYLKTVDLSAEGAAFVKRDAARKLISLALVAIQYSPTESRRLLASALKLNPAVLWLGLTQVARRSVLTARRALQG